MTLTLHEIQTQAYATAREKGWHDRPMRELVATTLYTADYRVDTSVKYHIDHDRVLAKLALIHSELAEMHVAFAQGDVALRIDRSNGKPEGLAAEAADVVIRIGDTCEALGLRLADGGELVQDDMWLDSQSVEDVRTSEGFHVALERARLFVDRATEAARVDEWSGFTRSLAAVVVHVVGICNGFGVDIATAVQAKMSYNRGRAHRHGGKQA